MSDDWSHWLFVGLFGVWVIAMIVCAIICWAHSRQVRRDEYEQPRHVAIMDDKIPYDWNRPFDQDEELQVPQEWVREHNGLG